MDDGLEAKCSCQQCGNHISFPLEAAGAAVNCPHCGQGTMLTLEEPVSAQTPHKLTAVDLINAFGDPVPRTPVSFFYQLGLVLVTFVMIILPIVYLAMIC